MSETITFGAFEWDKEKEALNISHHKLDFYIAVLAFIDMRRIIAVDERHNKLEPRFFCI